MSHRNIEALFTVGFWFCVAMGVVNLAFFIFAGHKPWSLVAVAVTWISAASVAHSLSSIRRSHAAIEQLESRRSR